MSKTTTLTKPKLAGKTTSEAALAFAEATPEQAAIAARRAFFAPEGYRRLTINLPQALHKKLRLAAVEQDCTATDIIERLLLKELYKEPAKAPAK